MIAAVLLVVAGVVFVLGAAMYVWSAAGEFEDQRQLDAWLRALHAEAPHEFDDRPPTGSGVVEADGVSTLSPAQIHFFVDGSL